MRYLEKLVSFGMGLSLRGTPCTAEVSNDVCGEGRWRAQFPVQRLNKMLDSGGFHRTDKAPHSLVLAGFFNHC